MPIQDKEVQKLFVSMPETSTVAQALDALQKKGGNATWMLFIIKGDGQIAACKFADLAALAFKFGPALFEAPLADLPVAHNIRRTVEANRTSIAQAEEDARHSPGKMLVVTAKGMPIGAISEADVMRGDLFSSSLTQLYGEYVKLSEDARGNWKPAGKEPPIQQPCGHKAWPELNDAGKWVCRQCKKRIKE